MAAKQSVMHELHEALAAMFLEDIRLCREAEIPMSSSDKMAISKFLKDNSITTSMDDEEIAALATEFQDELAHKRAAKAASILKAYEDDDLIAGII
jgi:hypothetical protein